MARRPPRRGLHAARVRRRRMRPACGCCALNDGAIDLRAHRGGRPQRAADAAAALLRRLAAARLAGQGEARAQRQRAFRLVAAARRQDRLLRARLRASRGCRRCSASRRSMQPPDLDAALDARGYDAFDDDAGAGRCRSTRPPRCRRDAAMSTLDAPPIAACSSRRSASCAASTARAARRAPRAPRQCAARRRMRAGRVATAGPSATGQVALEDDARRRVRRGHRRRTRADAARDAARRVRLLDVGVGARRAHAYLQVDRRQRAGARRVPQVRLRDRATRITTAAGRSECRSEAIATARERWRANSGERAARARLASARPPNRAPAASSPARSPTSPAARAGSIAASSPIRTRRRCEMLGRARRRRSTRTARCPKRRRARWRRARSREAARTSRSPSPGVAGPAAAARRDKPVGHRVLRAGRRRDGPVEAETRALRGRSARPSARRRSSAALAAACSSWRMPSAATHLCRRVQSGQAWPLGRSQSRLIRSEGLHRTIVLCHDRVALTYPPSRLPAACADTPETSTMPLDTPMDDNKSKALAAALAQIEKQFGKGSIMKMGEAQIAERPAGRVHRLARARHRARRRRPAARPRRRNLRPGVVGQDHAVPAGRRAGAEGRAASRRTSTPRTRSTPSTPASSASTSATC